MTTDEPLKTDENSDMDPTYLLPDGRKLGYREHGDPRGPAVFYFHGFPGSRLEPGFFPVEGVRIIAVDRPGYGLSTALKKRSLADWPNDVRHLADGLGLNRFAVMGVSGGAPYAAACAHALADRLTTAIVVCGLGPPEAAGMNNGSLKRLTRVGRRPVVANTAGWLASRFIRSKRMENRLKSMRRRITEKRTHGVPKEAAARTPAFMNFLLNNWRTGLSGGGRGLASDARVYAEPWHFQLSDIKVPMHLWHGTHDRVVPVSIGHHYTDHVPTINSKFTEGDGHFSVIVNSIPEIIETIKNSAK